MMADYRVQIKVRNARLMRAIESVGHQTGPVFARLVGIRYDHLLEYVNLKRSPFDENGDLRPCAEKLCVFLNRMAAELWSEEQCVPLLKNAQEIDLSTANVFELLSASPDYSDPLLIVEKQQKSALVDGMLERLGKSPSDNMCARLGSRYADVLRMRFGIDCAPMTLDQIANCLCVTRERVRQMESKALRTLRKKMLKEGVSDYLVEDL